MRGIPGKHIYMFCSQRLVVDSNRPVDIVAVSEKGGALEKVLESDWYLAGTEGPPYKNLSGEEENMDDSVDMLLEAMSLYMGKE